ncbi:putative sugar hydrolase [Aspergillus campestris IBT 28561]|uniref:alpha-D-xyloside xylohydrolase n=1 Tax=Aspergillus campestris (strain IBT 28561) TaxID=1392248 RepID=A0A2I1CZF3_ASPC2|nr:putative sugar hydrolase [Aspergillus campestris IBT 28561]PKY02981.1 putative sugar hydrolase [Aspergillus campestris IBT 28561]
MKFTEGMWRLREGVRIDWMSNVERLHIDKDKEAVDILMNKFQRHRGDTLNSATITARVTSPQEGIIGVNFVHWAGQVDRGPHYSIASSNGHTRITHADNRLSYTSGDLSLTMNTAPNELDLTFSSPTKTLTGHSFRSIGYVGDQTTPKTDYRDGIFLERQGHMLLGLDLNISEKLYGLGERFGPFVKNGQTVDIWNEDGGTSSDLAYKNIPFYISSRGYGVFVNHPGKVSLEMQTERSSRVNISIEGEELQYFVVYGPSPKEILRRYATLTGEPALVPAWSYNLWLTTSFTTNYDEQTVTSFLDGFRDRDIPLGVFHFDCFWMKSYQWCDFQFDAEMFPDAGAYLRRLKERGLKISVWLNPYVGQASPLFEEGKREGYFIKRTDSSMWQWDYWQAGMAVIDFTNPRARTWYSTHLHRLIDTGVDSFKTDFAERIPVKNVVYHDNSDPARMHNYYALLYNEVVYDVLTSRLGASNSILFARSTAPGGQRYPVHWGGDCESTYVAMAESLRGGLSLLLSGYVFWASDIGGFEGTPSPALYKRWVQFGLLSSHSRLHGSGSFRVPWLYGEDCSVVLKECTKRKIMLTPYLLSAAYWAAKDGSRRLMAPLFVEFPDDLNTYAVDTQFMLGPNLLVAPVFCDEGVVSFYVPDEEAGQPSCPDKEEGEGKRKKAKWVSFFDSSKTYEGGKWYTETHDFDTLPLLVRPGTVTPINRRLERPDGDALDGLELVVNGPLKEGEEGDGRGDTVVSDDGGVVVSTSFV